jgi:ABC-2 type transport system ATP-binding protein
MGLADVKDELVRTYSGGMIRRLEIAEALLHRPAIVFLDEPTVGLDPVARASVWERLKDLRARFGTTVLLTTHDMDEAEALCEYIAIMHRGRIVASGSPAELKASIGSAATLGDVFARYTGANIDLGIDADIEGKGGFREISRTRRTSQRLG